MKNIIYFEHQIHNTNTTGFPENVTISRFYDVVHAGRKLAKGKFFSKVKFSLVISTTFKNSRQKVDARFLEKGTFQSIPNLKMMDF